MFTFWGAPVWVDIPTLSKPSVCPPQQRETVFEPLGLPREPESCALNMGPRSAKENVRLHKFLLVICCIHGFKRRLVLPPQKHQGKCNTTSSWCLATMLSTRSAFSKSSAGVWRWAVSVHQACPPWWDSVSCILTTQLFWNPAIYYNFPKLTGQHSHPPLTPLQTNHVEPSQGVTSTVNGHLFTSHKTDSVTFWPLAPQTHTVPATVKSKRCVF